MAKTRKPRKPKPEQPYLSEDMAPVKHPRIHPLAKRYADLRDDRIAANKDEKTAHDNLLHAMLEEGLEIYRYGDLEVCVDNHRKCKVKTEAQKPSENGEEKKD